MSETPASILLIDDHPLLRQGIKQLIGMACTLGLGRLCVKLLLT